ncbi:LAFE_0F06414g1_1 [Lachancea fermentati]|uniref:Protein AF-9 homolog n=1 Tax=Lachancea fermentati TaxID=4955 RepID=A0A1G4MEZ5_LACFM|nr:LAFE_0F06414g1_1 [Lachancea fermentati]
MATPAPSKRIKTLSVSRPIVYGNTATKLGDNRPPNAPVEHTHMWTIFVRGPQGEDLSYFIKRVVFKLHDTYPNPTRTVEAPPFELTETGWGEFEINIKIHFIDDANEKMLNFYHHLRLHPYYDTNRQLIKSETNQVETEKAVNSEVQSIFFDEIVFNEPNEQFFKILMSTPGYLLPSNKTKEHIFSKQLEQEEIDRINMGIDKVDQEIEKLKQKLSEQIKPEP